MPIHLLTLRRDRLAANAFGKRRHGADHAQAKLTGQLVGRMDAPRTEFPPAHAQSRQAESANRREADRANRRVGVLRDHLLGFGGWLFDTEASEVVGELAL